jgi:hypothetical protein
MSKKKRAQRVKQQSHIATWNELEQAFFESAPPDEPQPAPEALSFHDLDGDAPRPGEIPVSMQRALDGLSRLVTAITSRLDRRTITIAVATFMLLVGLSAAVFARH